MNIEVKPIHDSLLPWEATFKFKRNGRTITAYERGVTPNSAIIKLKRLLGLYSK